MLMCELIGSLYHLATNPPHTKTSVLLHMLDRRGREIDPTLMQPIFWKMAFFLPPRHREKLLFGMPHERTPEHLPTKVAKKHPEQHASVATVVMELENGRAAPSPAPTIEYEISVL